MPSNSKDPRAHIEQALEQFKQDALAKFDKGRAEHGDDLSTLDLEKEIYDELLDIVVYRALKTL